MSTPQVVLAVPVRPCAPWCEKGDGHGDEHPEDRRCWSDYAIVPMRRHNPMQLVGDTWQMAYLNVYLHRGAGEDETLVYVHSEETDNELRLTPTRPARCETT
jgi:hypothetical protein